MAALSHVKSNIVPDFTGTATVYNSAGNTTTIAATDLVRPSDWNSAHNFFQSISGNTAGQSTASGTNLVIGGTDGITASMATAAGGATLYLQGATNTSPVNHTHGPGPTLFLTNLSGTTASASNGVTLSLSAAAPGGGAAGTLSGYNPYADLNLVAGQIGQGTLQFEPEELPNVQMDRLLVPIINTNATNSSGSHTISSWVGIYTRNVSTLSLLTSTSTSLAVTHSGTAGSYSLYSGMRLATIPFTTTLTAGEYWVGQLSRTTSGGANGTYSNLVASNIASNFVGFWSSAHNTTQQLTLGQGVYTATTSGMPASVAFSQIRGSDSAALRAPIVMFGSGTV